MSIFTIRNGKLDIEVENLTIPQFKIIYERDSSKDKSLAFNELAYVYHMADFKSIYNNYKVEEKPKKIIDDYFKNTSWKPDEVILKAIDKYLELQETPNMRLYWAAREAIDKIIDYYNTVDLTITDKLGRPIHKERDLNSSIANTGKLVESLEKIKEQIKKDQLKESKIRGQGEVSDYERE